MYTDFVMLSLPVERAHAPTREDRLAKYPTVTTGRMYPTGFL